MEPYSISPGYSASCWNMDTVVERSLLVNKESVSLKTQLKGPDTSVGHLQLANPMITFRLLIESPYF